MSRLIDADALLEKVLPKNPDTEFRCVPLKDILDAPTVEPEQQWVSCTPDTMPKDLVAVNVTWVNHNPPVYYNFIKDVPSTATAVFFREKWYWYSSVCVDVLAECGDNPADEIDKDIEIVAWIPLPEPYKEGE